MVITEFEIALDIADLPGKDIEPEKIKHHIVSQTYHDFEKIINTKYIVYYLRFS